MENEKGLVCKSFSPDPSKRKVAVNKHSGLKEVNKVGFPIRYLTCVFVDTMRSTENDSVILNFSYFVTT